MGTVFRGAQKAQDHLLSVKEIASQDPEWYVYMSSIQIHLDEERFFKELIREGLDKHPTYYQLYFANIEYLLPKWHGDKSKIEAFANEAVERTKNTEGMGMYARIYWTASQWNYGESLFTDSAVVWPRMKLGIKDVLNKYPDQWNINNFAFFACLAKDKETTKDLIQKIKEPVTSVWKDMSFFTHCKEFSGH